ncbi:MAG: NFACT RNA binding domain-containing protein [Lachnospiraceae bacterium]|nr:NFACT RNA binding domain-containing protein [Lachnospiraceae bacterium]
MAFDGITTAGIVSELNQKLKGGGISRIVQSEKDELFLTIKNRKVTYRLLMSANASLPLIYLTEERKEAPLTAPNFCMLLRKHLQGGQILAIEQPSLERIISFTVEHRDELGDMRQKKLLIELMGKYSNIILVDEENTIIDSIKRVPASVSSIREVLPGRTYFIPETQKKLNPLDADETGFFAAMAEQKQDIVKALYTAYTGISPSAAEEFVYEAGIEPRKGWNDLTETEKRDLFSVFSSCMRRLKTDELLPNIVKKDGIPQEFAVYPQRRYASSGTETFDSVSEMILTFYGTREKLTRIRQKSADLRHLVSTALDRVNKKLIIQEKQMASTEKKDKYRIYGEMLNTYGYSAEEGAKSLTCLNYYTNEEITVPLDETLSASENAQKYFARYNKLKRTAEALTSQIEETISDRDQLESVMTAIDLAENEADLSEIRRELADFGFAQRKHTKDKGAKREAKSLPYSYTSSDGFEMLVGRNNYQNEEVSFKIANGGDLWFHAKKAPGSHVIVRTRGQEVPDRTYEEAGALAAYYSSQRSAPKVEIDYTERRNLRKKNGGKPGFVIYHTNYSLIAEPDISGIQRNS